MICVGLDFPLGTTIEVYIELIENINADYFKLNPAFNPSLIKEVARELVQRNKKWI